MADLKKYEEKLQARLKELNERVHDIDDDLDAPGDDDFAEMSVEAGDDDVLEATGRVAQEEIAKILAALDRIKSGEYGRCQSCREAIPEARLEAVPYTSYCIKCAG